MLLHPAAYTYSSQLHSAPSPLKVFFLKIVNKKNLNLDGSYYDKSTSSTIRRRGPAVQAAHQLHDVSVSGDGAGVAVDTRWSRRFAASPGTFARLECRMAQRWGQVLAYIH